MKKFLLLLLIASAGYSQTTDEKKKIASASNKAVADSVKLEYQKYITEQNRLISDYVKNHPQDPNLGVFSLQRIVDGNPIFFSTDNATSVASIRANSMYPGGSLGLNVTGQGITVGVWDGGKVRNTHQELTGRITLGDSETELSSHATHVTGTIMASGVVASRRGFAYQANGKTHYWDNDINEMITYAASGGLVSNHSYGNIASNLQPYYFGNYNSQSIEVDNVMNAFPYYQVVKSAGNDRNNTSIAQVNLKDGYDLLSGVATAKNVLTVAAVEQVTVYNGPEDVIMSTFSNYGPTDDGRIKPEIAAKGVNIFSTNSTSDTAYTPLSGTSMAAPAITGLIALLQKHYNNLNPSTYMKSASVRALLCQSAREAGLNPGPDYEFGFGLADGLNAANVITRKGTTGIFDELNLANNATITKTFTINSTQDINVVIAWNDPTGNANAVNDEDNRSPRIKNNLDLKVIKDGTTYYPWKLDPDSPTTAATNDSDNNVDNIEKVQIFGATAGTYTIQINHKGSLLGGSQDFSLIASATNGLTLNNPDFIADNNFFLFPVPAKEVINFSNPNNFDVKEVAITDITGKVVAFNPTINSNSIDVSNLQSGVYFIKFTAEGFTTVKKFVKD